MIELNKIYNEDCLEGMKRIPDKSVDLIVIDPPYNIKKAEWDSWKTVGEYVEFMGPLIANGTQLSRLSHCGNNMKES